MWMIIKSAGDEYSFTEVYVEGKIGHTYRYAQIMAGKVTAAMKQAVEQSVQADKGFCVCNPMPFGMIDTAGNRTCSGCGRPCH